MTLFLEGSTGRSDKKKKVNFHHQKSSKINWKWFSKINYHKQAWSKNTAEEKVKNSRNLVEINSSCISWEENTLKQITTHTLSTHTHTPLSLGPSPLVLKTMLILIRKQRKLQHKHTHTSQKVEEMSKFYCFGPPRKCKQNFVTETKVQNLLFRHNLKRMKTCCDKLVQIYVVKLGKINDNSPFSLVFVE